MKITGKAAPTIFKVMWLTVTPILVIVIMFFSIIGYSKLTYGDYVVSLIRHLFECALFLHQRPLFVPKARFSLRPLFCRIFVSFQVKKGPSTVQSTKFPLQPNSIFGVFNLNRILDHGSFLAITYVISQMVLNLGLNISGFPSNCFAWCRWSAQLNKCILLL